MKLHTITAVFRRNVESYFAGALGYLIIVVFVFVCSLLAFNEQFFANNLATLDQLSRWYPILLLFLVPAITMGVWAEERKQHTEELLFTLPASDLEVLLGKYLAVLAVYTIALLFSTTLLIVLNRIGSPDWGVVFTTYLGYWLAGAALLSAGMFASSLTRSTTVAFVVGVLVSAVPVFLSPAADYLSRFGSGVGDVARSLAVSEQLRGFTEGLIPFTGILYFVSLAAFLLYLNYVVITKRHWSGGRQAKMGTQYLVRVAALAATLVSFNVMLQRGNAYVPEGLDLTAEKVHTLSPVTRDVIQNVVDKEEGVTIQAFLSPEVPDEFVPVRKELVNLLRQYDRLGGRYLTVRLVDVTHASDAETDARARGVEPIKHNLQDREGRQVRQDVYLGVVVEGKDRRVVIPHFRNRMQLEYELTRSLGTVMATKQLRVGILRTDARVLGMGKKWYFDRFVQELRKQYELVDVTYADLNEWAAESPDGGKTDTSRSKDSSMKTSKGPKNGGGKDTTRETSKRPDVLIVVQATSLPQPAMDDLVQYLQRGNPALIFDDPLPFYLVYDQTQFNEFFRGPYSELLDAPRLPRAQPRSRWAIELIPKSAIQKFNDWARKERRNRMLRSPQQWDAFLKEGFDKFYPEATPQVYGQFPIRKADNGTAATLMRALGLTWENGRVVTDKFNPHPGFAAAIPQKVVENRGPTWPVSDYGQKENAFLFLARAGGNRHALNAGHSVTKDLQEMMAIYAGSISRRQDAKTKVVPLLQTSADARFVDWEDLVVKRTRSVAKIDSVSGTIVGTEERTVESKLTNTFSPGQSLNSQLFPPHAQYVLADEPRRVSADGIQTIAAIITPGEQSEEEAKKPRTGKSSPKGAGKIKAVFVADVDMISDVFFRQQEALGLPLDNVNFVENAIEVLAGDERYVELRSRRPEPRSLTTIQRAVDEFRQERLQAEQKVKQETEEKTAAAQKRFDEKMKKIRESKDLNVLQKDQLQAFALRTEQERLEREKKRLKEDLKRRTRKLENEEDRQIRNYQNHVRAVTVAFTPVPALLLGLVVFVGRWINERRIVTPARHV